MMTKWSSESITPKLRESGQIISRAQSINLAGLRQSIAILSRIIIRNTWIIWIDCRSRS